MKNFKKIIVGIVIIGLCLGVYNYKINSVSASCGGNFPFCRSVTLTPGQIPANQSNFTVLVCANGASPCNFSAPGLNQTGAGNHVTNSNGFDITFWTNSDCSGAMNWEMEKYVASTGEMEAWVLITSLSTSGNVFYMCYGNSSISTFQGGATGTAWDTNYKAVYHLPDGTTLNLNDSTSGGNNGTNGGTTAIAGQIDGAASFSGASQYISTPTQNMANITISAWVKPNLAVDTDSYVVNKNYDGANVSFSLNTSNEGSSGGMAFFNGSWHHTGVVTNISQSNAVHFVTGTYDGTTLRYYLDGSQDSFLSFTGSLPNGSNTIDIGRYLNNGSYFKGFIDEVRISNIARSANWIATEYNNQFAPSTFETFGGELTSNVAVHSQVIIKNSQIIINKEQEIIN